MDKKLIARLSTLDIIATTIHYARGAQRHYEGHRWYGWGRRHGYIVYFGSHFTATECTRKNNTFTVSLDPFGDGIDIDCRK